MTDWGVHVLDIALLGMQDMAPAEIHGAGGKFFMTDDRETVDTQQVTYKFKDWLMNWETRLNRNGSRSFAPDFIEKSPLSRYISSRTRSSAVVFLTRSPNRIPRPAQPDEKKRGLINRIQHIVFLSSAIFFSPMYKLQHRRKAPEV